MQIVVLGDNELAEGYWKRLRDLVPHLTPVWSASPVEWQQQCPADGRFIVTTPAALRFLPRRAPVLAVLPAGSGMSGANQVENIARRRRLRLWISHPLRFHPGLSRLREVAATGVLGDLSQVTVRGSSPMATSDPADSLDVARWLLDADFSDTPDTLPVSGANQTCHVALTGGRTADIHGAICPRSPEALAPCHMEVVLTGALGQVSYTGPVLNCDLTSGTVTRRIGQGTCLRQASWPAPSGNPCTLELAWFLGLVPGGTTRGTVAVQLP